MNINGCYTHFVIKQEDAKKYLNNSEYHELNSLMDKIAFGRSTEDKIAVNNYYVVNKDEAWAGEVAKVIEKNTQPPLDWDAATSHIAELIDICVLIGNAGLFALTHLRTLERRYNDGERTQLLYDEMMEAH